MARTTIRPSALGDAIAKELTTYHQDVIERVNKAGRRAIRSLVKKTKETAPVQSGDFQEAITSTEEVSKATGDKTFTWGAKAPHHRLTHLLVNGHAKVGGGRVPGNPFLKNALEQVLPEYEKEVEEAVKNDK